MKFCKRYEEYMARLRNEELPVVGLKRLKKTLKRCRTGCHQSQPPQQQEEGTGEEPKEHTAVEGCAAAVDGNAAVCTADGHCPVCDDTFFPSLIAEMSAVVGSFNERARKLLHLHLATGFRKYLTLVKGKVKHNHGSLVDEGRDLVTYAVINSIAMRKILKKYDKVHHSKQGQVFRSQAQTMHIEVLHSPWLCELIAFYINTREEKKGSKHNNSSGSGSDVKAVGCSGAGAPATTTSPSGLFDNCSLAFEGDRPVLSCGLFDSLKLNIDLTCSICLDTVFDPVSLACGHIFCYICACGTSGVDIVDGLKAAESKAKCPLCRRAGVYKGAVRLDELTILLSRNCSDYWAKRRESERAERIKQAKKHWDTQCRAFVGF